MKKLFLILFTTLTIFGLLLCLKMFYSHNLRTENSGIYTALKDENFDYLFLGSSTFRYGLDVNLLEKNLADNVCIIAYNGNQPFLMLEEFKYLLSNNVKIKNLILEVSNIISNTPSFADIRITLDMDASAKMNIYNLINKEESFCWTKTYEYFVLSNNEYFLTYPISSYFMSKRYKKGGAVLGNDGITKEHGLNDRPVSFLNYEQTLNEIQLKSFLDLISLAQSKGIKVHLLEMPKFKTVSMNENYRLILTDFKNVLKNNGFEILNTDSDNLDFIEDESNFYDLNHISTKGRIIFFEKLINALKAKDKNN